MLEGVVPFPPEFAARYREKGLWEDRSLRSVFTALCAKYADRVAVIDHDQRVTYAQLEERATQLALNLLDLGLKKLDRIIVQIPNCVEFAYLYLALQKIGAVPVMALPSHRFLEVNQFAELSGAVASVTPDRQRDFDFKAMITRIQAEHPALVHGIVLGDAADGFLSLADLIARRSTRSADELRSITIDPSDPALFLLSGGTTGIPKLIPRTHNDYVLNSKLAGAVTEVYDNSVLLDVLPISHNLPLACPGLQGFLFKGATVVLDTDTAPENIFALVQKHKVTHIHVVPALLIRWINDPSIGNYDLSTLRMIQSGGQRLQPEVRLKTKALIPSVFVQENFGMAEGVLMFVRVGDPEDVRLETVGRPICPEDEIRIVDEDDRIVTSGETGEMCCRGPYTLRGYFGVPEYNKRAFTSDGFYRSGDLMRQHPSGNYMVEGRKKDLVNRGGEKISAEEIENLILSHPSVQNVACIAVPDPDLGEKMCACVILNRGTALTFDELSTFLLAKEIARNKVPEYLEIMDEFPVSTFGKVSKKVLVETISPKIPAMATAARAARAARKKG
jgi:2,3-dihydroxybenzoate-AMP ligase